MEAARQDVVAIATVVKAPRRVRAPQAIAPAQRLAERITRAVRRRTADHIHNLQVQVHEGVVLLRGSCATFYSKQLAQHAAMALVRVEQVNNHIEVREPRPRPR